MATDAYPRSKLAAYYESCLSAEYDDIDDVVLDHVRERGRAMVDRTIAMISEWQDQAGYALVSTNQNKGVLKP